MRRNTPGLARMCEVVALVVTFSVAGCSESGPVAGGTEDALMTPDGSAVDSSITDWSAVVDNRQWMPTPEEDDPFFADRGNKAAMCAPDDYRVEEFPDGPWFDITTSICGYLTVDQPALAPVATGEMLRIRVWHFQIIAGDGPYHLELAVRHADGTTTSLWSEEVAVPAESELFYLEWESPTDIAAGDNIYWHVSNHGINTWGFIELLTSK